MAIKNEMKTADVARWLKTTTLGDDIKSEKNDVSLCHRRPNGTKVEQQLQMLESEKKKFSLLRKAIRNE